MDTSEYYIQMCQKAQELQPAILNKGDYWIINGDTKDGFPERSIENGCIFIATLPMDRSTHHNTTWLPRQDQLQAIALEKIASPVKPEVLKLAMFTDAFNCFVNNLAAENTASGVGMYNPIDTLEKLWLMWVMRSYYGKQWNPIHEAWLPSPNSQG